MIAGLLAVSTRAMDAPTAAAAAGAAGAAATAATTGMAALREAGAAEATLNGEWCSRVTDGEGIECDAAFWSRRASAGASRH